MDTYCLQSRVRCVWGLGAVVSWALLLGGCGKEASSSPTTVTWYRDIQPLVERTCAACHDGRGVGGVDLLDVQSARAHAARMAFRVDAGEMPPPALDPACRSYAGAERLNLTEEERARIVAWAEAGAPLGNPMDAPPKVERAGGLGVPDATLEMPTTYTLSPDSDGNEYHCMILQNPFSEPVWITGIDATPGNPEVVHHLALFRDEGHDAGSGYGAPPGATEFPCRNPVLELDWRLLHSWAPGVGATLLSEGTGIRIDPGDQLVMQAHYYAPGMAGAKDRSAYGLRVTHAAPAREVTMDVFGPVPFTIPAGASAHTEQSMVTNQGKSLLIHGLMPHMHLLGRSYKAWIEDDMGTSTCAARGEFDFNHQGLYVFDEPLHWGAGSHFMTQCTWNNSPSNPDLPVVPPVDVSWGEGTDQEMCFMIAYVSEE